MAKKNLKSFIKKGFVVVATLLVVSVVAYLLVFGKALNKEISVYVGPDTKCSEVAEALSPAFRTPLHRLSFSAYASYLGLSEKIKTGHYKFNKNENVLQIARRLLVGKQTPVRFIIRGARTLPQLAGRISSQICADSAEMLAAMRDPQIRKELGLVRDSTISIFIPNTYEVYWNESPEKILHRMHREYKRFWNDNRKAKLQRCRLSQYEVMTLASIVYEEVKVESDMLLIAGVYINRLRKGMPLQADPTVKYAIGDFAMKRILRKHLKYESPFNTYLNQGLPPAPICIPSIKAIDAVLNYAEHDYLYFCARPELDGRHNFATNYEAHKANARRYAEALDRRGIK